MSTTVLRLVSSLDVQSDPAAEKIIAKLVKLGKIAVPELLEAVVDQDQPPHVRQWSLLALGSIGDKRGIPLLLAALENPRMSMRLQALKGLRRMKHRKSVKEIAKLLKDKSGGIRVNALYALAELGDASVARPVMAALRDSQWYVRQNACIACGRLKLLGSKRKLLLLAKKDEKKAVRQAAATALKIFEA